METGQRAGSAKQTRADLPLGHFRASDCHSQVRHSGESCDRLILVVEDVEDGDQLRDLQNIVDLW